MKVGITGASGFLGRAIAKEAKRRRWKVIGFSRSSGRTIEGVSECRSLDDLENLEFSDLDVLIHLSGEPIVGWWSREKKRRIRDSRIDLTHDIVEAIGHVPRAKRPKVLICASAIGLYGNRGDEILDEEAEVGFGFIPELVRDWEETSLGAKDHGVRVVLARIGLVMGDGGMLGKIRTLFRLGLGGKLGRGNQWMSWIHIRDLARIFAECVKHDGLHGAVNVVGPNPVTNREFTQTYAKVLGRKAWFPVPAFVLNWLPGGMGCLFLDSQRVEASVMNAFGFEWEFTDLESALTEIESNR